MLILTHIPLIIVQFLTEQSPPIFYFASNKVPGGEICLDYSYVWTYWWYAWGVSASTTLWNIINPEWSIADFPVPCACPICEASTSHYTYFHPLISAFVLSPHFHPDSFVFSFVVSLVALYLGSFYFPFFWFGFFCYIFFLFCCDQFHCIQLKPLSIIVIGFNGKQGELNCHCVKQYMIHLEYHLPPLGLFLTVASMVLLCNTTNIRYGKHPLPTLG